MFEGVAEPDDAPRVYYSVTLTGHKRVECSERRKPKVIHLEATVYEHGVYSFWEVKDEISHE